MRLSTYYTVLSDLSMFALSEWITNFTDYLYCDLALTFGNCQQVTGIPVVFISALEGRGRAAVLHQVIDTYEKWCSRLPTARLNRWLQKVFTPFQTVSVSLSVTVKHAIGSKFSFSSLSLWLVLIRLWAGILGKTRQHSLRSSISPRSRPGHLHLLPLCVGRLSFLIQTLGS